MTVMSPSRRVSPLRRLGGSAIAVAASAALITGCSNSTSGNPLGLGSATGSAGASSAATSGAVAPGGSSNLPAPTSASSLPTVSSGASVGGGTRSEFCTQLSTIGSDLGNSAGDPSGAKALADKFQKLADIAPAEIKPDVQKMADYLKSVSSGSIPDASATSGYTEAAQRVIKYLTSACI